LAHGQGGTVEHHRLLPKQHWWFFAGETLPRIIIWHIRLRTTGRQRKRWSRVKNTLRLAPAIPHAHHMHGHNLRRLGRTEEAIREFLKAEELENAYYRTEGIPPQYDWHHAHNLQLLGMSYQALGQMKAARGGVP